MISEFNLDDWPDDGTDWDGVHDPTMKVILSHKEKLEKITAYAKNLVYSQPAVSWQLKQLLRDTPPKEPEKPR